MSTAHTHTASCTQKIPGSYEHAHRSLLNRLAVDPNATTKVRHALRDTKRSKNHHR